MKKILLLTTGGTIASGESEEGLTPSMNAEELLELIPGVIHNNQIHVRELFRLDSSNVQPEEWVKIARTIAEECGSYDGVVLTHGTDTMAYTASALSFLLSGIPIPVVLTGSQLPIRHPLTDGVENLRCAFAMAASERHGVFVAFNRRVINGTRAVKIRTEGFDAFESVNAPYTAIVDSTGLRFNEPPSPSLSSFSPDFRLDNRVFLVKLTPGLNPEFFDMLLEMNYHGILVEAFGAGGIHFVRRNLIEKLQKLTRNGVAVVVCSQCLYEGSDFSIYQTGRKALSSGVIESGDMTSEAALTKLMWALARIPENANRPAGVKELFSRNLCGEITI